MREFIQNVLMLLVKAFHFYVGWNLFFVEILNFQKTSYLQALGFMLVLSAINTKINFNIEKE